MDVSFSQVVKQNTIGQSEGFPVGVPKSYNWFKGWNNDGKKIPPPHFTAVEGWGQVYHRIGAAPYSNTEARVEVANAKTFVRSKAGGWTLVQDQTKTQLVGGHFVPSFQNNTGYPMTMVSEDGGRVSFSPPTADYNDHFWFGARGTYTAGSIDAVYVQMDIRVTDAGLNLIASVGADWWRDTRAPYLHDHSNNPGAGSSNWVKLSTEWSTLGFYSSQAVKLHADPPPPLAASARETPAIVSSNATLVTTPSIVSFTPDTGAVGDGVTSANALTLNGSAYPGSSVKVFNRDRQIGVATADDNGVWSFPTGRLKLGKQSFVVKQDGIRDSADLISNPMAVQIEVGRVHRPSSDRASLVRGGFDAALPLSDRDASRPGHLHGAVTLDLLSNLLLMLLLVMAGRSVMHRRGRVSSCDTRSAPDVPGRADGQRCRSSR